MSEREEERNKSCPSRGLGIAAAAIGVGVGAALYYIFSKRPEHPNNEGATSSSWSCDEAQALHDSSYSTISEHSTTDTSINSSSSQESDESEENIFGVRLWNVSSDISLTSESESISDSDQSFHSNMDNDESDGTDMEWDVTTSSLDVPRDVRSMTPSPIRRIRDVSTRLFNLSRRLRNRIKNRERTWSPEECTICFELMQVDQEVFSLPCTHRFHQGCILPWLEQQQTCPCCRKAT